MRTDVRFQALKGQLRSLLNSGLPKDLICQILEIKRGALNLYIKKLEEDEAFPPHKSQRELFLDHLRGFSPRKYSSFIEEYLDLKTLRIFFERAVTQTEIMGLPRFYDDVPEAYRNLISDMYPRLSYGDEIFRQCLTKALMPEFCSDKIDQVILTTNLLFNFVDTYTRFKVAPVFDAQVVPLIDQAIESLENPRQALVLDYFYGLKRGVPADIKLTAIWMNLTPSTVRNIKARAMILLSLSPRQEIWQGGYLNWQKTTSTIVSHRDFTKRHMVFLEDCLLSVAAARVLGKTDIQTLDQLAATEYKDLHKIRGCSTKTMTELEGLLKAYGMNFYKAIEKPTEFIDGKRNLKWAEFDCSVRVKNFLKRCFAIDDLEELLKLSEKEIRDADGGGKKTVIEVRKLLADNGY